MLSRVADSLFWISRSMERADNVARLIDSARRMVTLPVQTGRSISNEWSSILIAAGASKTFVGDFEHADRDEALEHLIADPENPSSIYCCFRNARENARAIRFGLTAEVWNILNTAWNDLPNQIASVRSRRAYLAEFVDWVKICQAQYRGSVESTMVRDDSLEFLRLGSHLERADATARILDVKYHVLLPSLGEIGGSLDQYQWVSLLQAVGMQRAYHFVTHEDVTRKGVTTFLMQNELNPRSLAYSLDRILTSLKTLEGFYDRTCDSRLFVEDILADIRAADVDYVLNSGLHEFLTKFIHRTAELSQRIALDFAFAPPIQEEKESEMSQSQTS